MLNYFAKSENIPPRDVCVVGAGPVGIAISIELAKRGFSVLLIESGKERPDERGAELSSAIIVDEKTHAPMQIASCRALGGTSWWWGGRCVPYDQFDFAKRAFAPTSNWPITYEEIQPWYSKAASFLGCGPAQFTKIERSIGSLPNISVESLERWTPETNIGRLYERELRLSTKICLLLGATVSALHFSSDATQVTAITIKDSVKSIRVPITRCILSCGGLENTRLLLVARQAYSHAFTESAPVLGRFYSGHISGKIADVVINDASQMGRYDFFVDANSFVRRRFTIQPSVLNKERLLNIAFWVDNPPFYDSNHRSAILSLVWLMLRLPFISRKLLSDGIRIAHVGPQPFRYRAHISNIIRSPLSIVVNAWAILCDRFLRKPRKPGFLINNPRGRYAIHYHSEQRPNFSSHVTLADERDSLGVPRLKIDFRYDEYDIWSVLRAHEILDGALRDSNIGRLEYRFRKADRLESIRMQANDGFHQTGTTRMSATPGAGVVDQNCRVHGVENLFVAGSSVFPSSGQANPTFLAVAMAFRLASHIAEQKGNCSW